MRIHAYRRKEPITVTIEAVDYVFTLNGHGEVVLDVDDAHAIDCLLAVPTDYREHDAPEGDAPKRRGRPPKVEQP